MPIFCFDTSKIYDNADDCFKTTLVLEPQCYSNCFHFFTMLENRKKIYFVFSLQNSHFRIGDFEGLKLKFFVVIFLNIFFAFMSNFSLFFACLVFREEGEESHEFAYVVK